MFWAAVSAVAQNTLFTNQLKSGERGYVYSFIERYFHEIQNLKNSDEILQKLNDDKVYFAHGTYGDIKHLSQDLPFSLNCIEDRYYEATWTDNKGKSIITIMFPVSYELLLGNPKIEIEKKLYQEIISEKQFNNVEVEIHTTDVQLMDNGLYRTNPRSHYQLETLNNCLYYCIDSRGGYQLVRDTTWLEQSAINMFHKIQEHDFLIDVEQGVYGFKSLHFQITLNQWTSYCLQKGMTIYAALEEESKNVLRMLVVAECRELGFNHLLSVDIPRTFLTRNDQVWSAKLNGYIPTHNVKDLYQQYKQKPKRNIAL